MPLPSIEAREKEFQKNKQNNVQKVHNSFIENALMDSNIQALKIVLYLSTVLKDIDLNADASNKLITFILNYDDILEFTNISDVDVTKRLKSMQKTSIKFKNIEEEWTEYTSMLPRFKRLYGKKQVEIDIYKSVAKLIVDVPKEFGGTILNVFDICKLKNKHSVRMLPLLHMINGFKSPALKQKSYTLEDLNSIFGVNSRTLFDIENKILKDVQSELNTTSKMGFKYEVNMGYLGVARGRPKALDITIIPVPKPFYQGSLEF